MKMPAVGIIVPCYNQSRFAEECVASLEAQTWSQWRAVLLDDASTEPEAQNLDRLGSDRVTVIHLKRNLGRALVRNEGARRLADVDYVLNVDCDDVLTAEYVERLVKALENAPNAGIAYGTLRYFGAPHPSGAETWPPHAMVTERRFVENVIPGGGTMIRRAALHQTDGWRAVFTQCSAEDYDFWLQIVEAGWDVLWVREAEYLYRQHESSFIARSTEREQLRQALGLLRFHHRAIKRASGLESFLTPLVMPRLFAALRGGRLRDSVGIAGSLLRYAPITALRLAARHYVRQLRARS